MLLGILVPLANATVGTPTVPPVTATPNLGQQRVNSRQRLDPNWGRVFLRPGVQDPYKPGWSHTLDTLWGTQAGEAQRNQIITRYQDYAILASSSDSVGDFQFDIWITQTISDIRIYMPSNFTFAYTSSGYGEATTNDKIFSVWTDITNDYSYISVRTLMEDDPIAPGWDCVEVGLIPTISAPSPSFVIIPGLYHVRLFQVRAPFTAGLYHFKIYVDGVSIGAGNFPIVIVRSDLQPARVTGLVLLRELFPPILVSGRITASGTTSLGKYAEAVAYFGPGDFVAADTRGSYYRYWLFGLPAGTYDLAASASGFLEDPSRITVTAGQSLVSDFSELERGVVIYVTVWSKDENGLIPWGNLWQLPYGTNDPSLPINDQGPHRDILLRLYDEYDESLGYWASDDIDAPYGPPWNTATIDGKRSYSPFILKPSTLPSSTSYGVTLTDSRGLPSVRLDGHVPADAADLVEGIGGGSYRLEIQVTGYVMREADDWQRSFTAASSGKFYALQVDLRRSGWIMASAIVPNPFFAPRSNSTLVVVAESTDNLEGALAAGRFPAGANQFTIILEGFNGEYNKFRNSTDYQDSGLQPISYRLEVYMADLAVPFTGNPGIGWYILSAPAPEVNVGFGAVALAVAFHLEPSSIEFTLRSTRIEEPVSIAPWTFPGAGIRVYLIDDVGNLAAILSPNSYGLVQDDGTIIGDPYDIDTSAAGWHGLLRVLFTGTDPGPIAALEGLYPTRIEEGEYLVNVATFGYVQREDCSVYVAPGVAYDLQVDLVQGTQIRVELYFRHEGEPTTFNGFVRVEVYDQEDDLVGASIYAGADPNPSLGYYLPYDPSRDWKLVAGAAEGAGTGPQPQRAFYSRYFYGIPPITWANWPAMTRSDANRLSIAQGASVAFDVYGFHSYQGGRDSRTHKLWADGWDTTNGATRFDQGIRGSRNALDLEGWGNFTVRVWAFDPYGPDGTFDSNGPDGVFGTEDDYTSPDALDGCLSDFRAYAQIDELTGVEAPWGGATAVHVTLEDMSSLSGEVYWVDMYGDQRTLVWAQVIDTSPGGTFASSTTGNYRLWLSAGSHEFFVTTTGREQLWEPFYFKIVAGNGARTFRDIVLTTAGRPIPEFANAPTWLALLSLTLLLLLSKRRIRRCSYRES